MSDEIQTLTPEPVSSTAFMSLEDAFSFAPGETLATPPETTPALAVDTEPKTDANALAGQPDASTEASGEPKGDPAKPNEPSGDPAENVPWHKDPRWQAWQEEKRQFEAERPKLEFARRIESEWGSIEAYNQAIEEANRASIEAQQQAAQSRIQQEQADAEAAIWAEAQAYIDAEDMTESAAAAYANSRIQASRAEQEARDARAELESIRPTLQSVKQQEARAQAEQAAQMKFAELQAKFPQMDPDAVYVALFNGVKDPEAIAQRSHERIMGEAKRAEEAAEAKYNEMLKQYRAATPTPVGSSPGMVPAGQARIDPKERISIADVFNGKYG